MFRFQPLLIKNKTDLPSGPQLHVRQPYTSRLMHVGLQWTPSKAAQVTVAEFPLPPVDPVELPVSVPVPFFPLPFAAKTNYL